MFKNLRHVYSILVCFVFTMIMVVCVGLMVDATTDLVLFEHKYASEFLQPKNTPTQNYESDSSSIGLFIDGNLVRDLDLQKKEEREQSGRVYAYTGFIKFCGCFMTSMIFFIIHSRYVKDSSKIYYFLTPLMLYVNIS